MANEVAHAVAHGTTTGREPDRKAPEESDHAEPTRKELYDEAKELGVDGRSTMSKEELQSAIEDA